MKYHNHTIKRVVEDLGFNNDRDNSLYYIYDKDGKKVGEEPCLHAAKELVDYGESTF